MLRAAFALPFALLLAAIPGRNALLTTSQNGLISARVSQMALGGTGNMQGLADFYPLGGVLLVRMLPGGVLGLSILGVVAAGFFLLYLFQTFKAKNWDTSVVILLLITIGSAPVFAELVVGNLLGFLSLVTFGFGMIDMYRFVTQRHTDAGFRAGTWFLVCALMDTSGILLVAIAALTAPFLRVARRDESGARATNFAILFYPVLAVFISIAILSAIFLRNPFALFAASFIYDPMRWSVVSGLLTTLHGWIVILIVIAGTIGALLSGRRLTAFLPPLIMVALLLGEVLGVVPTNDIGYFVLAISMVLIAVWHRVPSQRNQAALIVVFGSLLALSWAATLFLTPTGSVVSGLLGGIY